MGRGNNASVAAALAAYRSGRAADARGIAEEVWSGSSDAAAACLLALLEMEAGRLESALAWNDRACIADPRDPRYATQGASRHAQRRLRCSIQPLRYLAAVGATNNGRMERARSGGAC